MIHLYAVTTVRLIGWWADRALVVAFRPEPVTDIGPDGDEQAYAPTDYGLVRRLSILAVTPSSSPSQPPRSQDLMILPDQILSIDIAGRTVPSPPVAPLPVTQLPVWPARPGVLTALIGLPAAPLAFVVFLAGSIGGRGLLHPPLRELPALPDCDSSRISHRLLYTRSEYAVTPCTTLSSAPTVTGCGHVNVVSPGGSCRASHCFTIVSRPRHGSSNGAV